MANCASAKKRIRQNETHRIQNKGIKSEIKTLTKKLEESIEKKDVDGAKSLYPLVISKMDKAGRKRIYHPNMISRKKSQLAKLISSLES